MEKTQEGKLYLAKHGHVLLFQAPPKGVFVCFFRPLKVHCVLEIMGYLQNKLK